MFNLYLINVFLQGPPGKDGLPGHPGQRGEVVSVSIKGCILQYQQETICGNLLLFIHRLCYLKTVAMILYNGKPNQRYFITQFSVFKLKKCLTGA